MTNWEPIIDNTKGILYFRDTTNNKIQFDYPKKYNFITGEYEDIFFEDWVKETIINKDSFNEKQYIWKNIKNGFIQKINPNSTTFILEAALNDNIAFFELYIEYGGNINYVDKLKRNCLHYIAINDNYILANLLIKLGCKVNTRDIYGITPFLYCIKYYSFRTMKLLIKNKCNINIRDNKGNTALHYAVMNQNTKLIIYLLKHGANLEIKNNKGKYPIDVAMDKNYSKIAKALTKYSYIIEDEKYYKLKEMVNSNKYDELLIKKYKEYEEEEINDNVKEIKKVKLNNKMKKKENNKKKKSKTKNNNLIKKKLKFKNEKLSTNMAFLSTEKYDKNKTNKTNKNNIINLNLSPIKNKGITLFNNNKDKFTKNKNNISFKEKNKYNNIINNNYSSSSSDNNNNLEEEEEEIDDDKNNIYKTEKDECNEENNNNQNKNIIKLQKNNNQEIILSNQDSIYSKSFNFFKYYINIFYLFLINTIYPYIKSGSLKLYNYLRKKGKKLYKNLKIYMHNTYLYYNNTPDIENQIEYLNYTGLSSSIDEASFHSYNPNNKTFLSIEDVQKIENDLRDRNKINVKKKKNNNWMQRRKLSYYKKKYVYKIPYKLLYNLTDDDFPKINEQKMIRLLNKFHKDKLFIKSFISHFNINIKKILKKWSNKKDNNSYNDEQLSIYNIDNINNKDIFNYNNIEESYNINNDNDNNFNINESNKLNKIDELFNFNESNNYGITKEDKYNNNNLVISDKLNSFNDSIENKSKIQLDVVQEKVPNIKVELSKIKIKSFNNKDYQRYGDEEDEEEDEERINEIINKDEIIKNEDDNNLFKNKSNIFDILKRSKNDYIKNDYDFENKVLSTENKLINDGFFKESIYSRNINKTLDNINSMLDEINEVNKNNKLNNNDLINKRRFYINKNKNENSLNDKKEYPNKETKLLNRDNNNNNNTFNKNEILEKILLDYNSKLREIKN